MSEDRLTQFGVENESDIETLYTVHVERRGPSMERSMGREVPESSRVRDLSSIGGPAHDAGRGREAETGPEMG